MPPKAKAAEAALAVPASDFAARLRDSLLQRLEAQVDVEALAETLAVDLAEKVIGAMSIESLQDEVMIMLGNKLATDEDLCAKVAAAITDRLEGGDSVP
jgi:hypothetical protein